MPRLFATKPPPSGVIMVIGGRGSTPGVIAGLRLLNQRRDSLARHLNAPLLWCGPSSFFDSTWQLAPDFWSVAAVPARIHATPGRIQERAVSWTTSSSIAEDQLLARYADALVQHDVLNAVRIGLTAVESLGAHGKLAAALDPIQTLEGMLRGHESPALQARIHLLKGRLGALAGAAESDESELTRALAAYRGLGDPDGEIDALVALGALHVRAGDVAAADAAVVTALDLLSRRPDAERPTADALVLLGEIEVKRGHLGEAEGALARARDSVCEGRLRRERRGEGERDAGPG